MNRADFHPIKICKIYLFLLIAIGLLLGGLMSVRAQDQTLGQNQSPAPTYGLSPALLAGPPTLGPIWRDEEDGFQVRPPDGCVSYGKSEADLASFQNLALKWDIIIHLSELAKPADVDSLMQEVLSQIRGQFLNVVVLQQNRLYVSGRRAGLLILHLKSTINKTSVDLLWQQFMVQASSTRYYVLTFSCPPDQEADARDIFTKMIGTFQLLDIQKTAAQRMAAIDAGRKWLAGQTAENLLAR